MVKQNLSSFFDATIANLICLMCFTENLPSGFLSFTKIIIIMET